MPRLARVLTFVLVTLGIPTAGAVAWQDVVLRFPLAAALLLVAYEALLGLMVVVVRPLRESFQADLDQAGRILYRRLRIWMSRYGRHYRRYVLTERFIDWKGLPTVPDHTPELDQIFVDVGLAPRPPHQISAGVVGDDQLASAGVAERRSIHDFIDQGRGKVLAVIGAPGSGKTTLLRHVALTAARGQGRRKLPILLTLRDCSGWIAQHERRSLPDLLRDSRDMELSRKEPTGWWEWQLEHGRCVVLLDGLDEVAREEDRHKVTEWVQRQIRHYWQHNDWVITSRPHGYRTAEIAGAQVLQVRDFTDQQVREFLHGWYLAAERHATLVAERNEALAAGRRSIRVVASTAGVDSAVRRRAAKEAGELIDRLAAAPEIYDLAHNPLLLTMIALVHRYRQALPQGRADLYNEICEVMLWRRQDAKRLAVRVPGQKKLRVLAHLAYTMMDQQVRELPRDRVAAAIAPDLAKITEEVTAEDFLADMTVSGLVVERERGRYAFAHHTIGEYLASLHIRENGLSNALNDLVDDAWWRETILLYVAAGGDADPIVTACLERKTTNTLALAFDCVQAHVSLTPALRHRLLEIQEEAFRDTADPARRRLVAGVLATRHLSLLAPTSNGSYVCPRPVTTDLYWLFCRETGNPFPDGTANVAPSSAELAVGLWSTDADAFVQWINHITIAATDQPAEYRLPTRAEVENLVARGGSAAHHLDQPQIGGIWLGDGSTERLWRPAATRNPHQVSVADITEAVEADAERSRIVFQLLLLGARAIAVTAQRTLDHVRARAAADEAIAELTSAHHRTTDLRRALDRMSSLFPQAQLPLDQATEIDECLQRDLNHFRARDMQRPSDMFRDLSTNADVDQDLARARELARSLADDLGKAMEPTVLHLLAGDVDPDIDTDADPADRAQVDGATMGVALTAGLAAIRRLPAGPDLPLAATFTRALLQAARVPHTCQVPPEELERRLTEAHDRFQPPGFPRPRWTRTVAGRLVQAARPVLARRTSLAAVDPQTIRLPALVLAAEAQHRQWADVASSLVQLAAGITLLEQRATGPVPREALLLART